MANCIYSFNRCTNGNLVFKGKYHIKYRDSETENNVVTFDDFEIMTAKDNFLVDKNRVVKNGSTWLNSKLAKTLLTKWSFV